MSAQYTANLAWEAENYIVPQEGWGDAPKEAIEALERTPLHIPVALAKHPTEGWLVLESNNTGPRIMWTEQDR